MPHEGKTEGILGLIISKDAIKPRESWVLLMNFVTLSRPGSTSWIQCLAQHQYLQWVSAHLNSWACLGISKGRTGSQKFSGIPRPSCPFPAGPATPTARTFLQPRGSIIVSEVFIHLQQNAHALSSGLKPELAKPKVLKFRKKVSRVWNPPHRQL